MSDIATQTESVKSCLIIDTFSVYQHYRPQRVDYTFLLNELKRHGFELLYVKAYTNVFDPYFAEYLRHLNIQMAARKQHHQYDLVRECIELTKSFQTVLLFTEETYLQYVREECNRYGSYLWHIGSKGDIVIDDTFLKMEAPKT